MMKSILLLIVVSLIFINCSQQQNNDGEKHTANAITFNDDESIRYYEKVYFKTYGNCEEDEKEDCAELKIEYPELINSGAYADSVNQFILSYILNLPFNQDVYKDFDEIADSLISNYISVQQEFGDYHTGWFIHSKTEFVNSIKDVISVKSTEVMYTGGANVYYNVTFTNFDIRDGSKLQLDNIIDKSNLSKIVKIGKEIFIKQKNIPANQTFEEAGFWFENKEFALNDNFAITDSGLVFFYNLYEIAPRSEGTIELFIPKARLTSLTDIY